MRRTAPTISLDGIDDHVFVTFFVDLAQPPSLKRSSSIVLVFCCSFLGNRELRYGWTSGWLVVQWCQIRNDRSLSHSPALLLNDFDGPLLVCAISRSLSFVYQQVGNREFGVEVAVVFGFFEILDLSKRPASVSWRHPSTVSVVLPFVDAFIAVLDLDRKPADIPRLGLAHYYGESLFANEDWRWLLETAQVHILWYAPRDNDKFDHVNGGRDWCTDIITPARAAMRLLDAPAFYQKLPEWRRNADLEVEMSQSAADHWSFLYLHFTDYLMISLPSISLRQRFGEGLDQTLLARRLFCSSDASTMRDCHLAVREGTSSSKAPRIMLQHINVFRSIHFEPRGRL